PYEEKKSDVEETFDSPDKSAHYRVSVGLGLYRDKETNSRMMGKTDDGMEIKQYDAASIPKKLDPEEEERERQACELRVRQEMDYDNRDSSVDTGRVRLHLYPCKHVLAVFVVPRYIVGVGEASYAVISPSIIADMFTGENRSRMLMFFYFAIPCGSGLGFMVGSSVAALTGDWKWGVRITAVLGVICLLAIIVFIREPERGGAEREKGEIVAEVVASSYLDDLRSLATNLTYMSFRRLVIRLLFSLLELSLGGLLRPLSTTTPANMDLTARMTSILTRKAQVNLIFGAITCIGGIAGVGIGSTLAGFIRTGYGPFYYVQTQRSDAIVCGLGALIAVPTLFFAIHEIPHSMAVCWVSPLFC
ncbi:spinster 1 domain protein, partial [Ostertagia ostertagi]